MNKLIFANLLHRPLRSIISILPLLVPPLRTASDWGAATGSPSFPEEAHMHQLNVPVKQHIHRVGARAYNAALAWARYAVRQDRRLVGLHAFGTFIGLEVECDFLREARLHGDWKMREPLDLRAP